MEMAVCVNGVSMMYLFNVSCYAVTYQVTENDLLTKKEKAFFFL